MYAKSLDLLIAVTIALASIVLALSGLDLPVVPILLGVPLVLVLPGYVLTSALTGPGLGVPERIVMTVGLSLSATALGGLVLNLTAWGLQPGSWAIWLGGLTVLGSGLAYYRRRTAPQAVASPSFNPGFNGRQTLQLGLAGVIVVGALLVARAGVQDQTTRFTQFWMTPTQSSQNTVTLGVISNEATPVKYEVRLENGGNVIKQWPTIELAPNSRWEITTDVPQTGKVEAKLYRVDAPDTVYRWATLNRDSK